MSWNWQQKQWPKFTYDSAGLENPEREYARLMGSVTGMMKHVKSDDMDQIVVQMLSTEGVKTSEIEGELLNRDSVQSSIRRKLGLQASKRKVEPAEAGIAEMMVEVYRNYNDPLSHKELHRWNAEVMQGRTDLETVGEYRTHDDPMQVVSGSLGMEKIHFEAPPSAKVTNEMGQFVHWFNDSVDDLPPLTRAGIAHLHSVSIHPYEDGNGRMARALVEKSLSQSMGTPALSGLSRQIVSKKSAYYDALERNNKNLDITDWLLYFADTAVKAKEYTLKSVERVLQKTAFYREFGSELNARQKKVIDKLYEAEPEGFEGGLSAGNYIAITKAPRATATRDLAKLVEMGILKKKGERRFARYWLGEG